jgi:hypothetical protein
MECIGVVNQRTDIVLRAHRSETKGLMHTLREENRSLNSLRKAQIVLWPGRALV